MSAKFLHGITDDPQVEREMEKQIGCMAGFLQLFDRHQILTGRRLYGPKRLAAARSSSSSPRLDTSADASSAQNMTSQDIHGPSLDSAGFSNASSRASSMDYNEQIRQPVLFKEQMASQSPAIDRTAFQSRVSENSGMLSAQHKDVKLAQACENSRGVIPSREHPRYSLDSSRHSLDIRDVVRDSFHRDPPKLSMDARVQSKIEANKHGAKQGSWTDGRDATTGKETISPSRKSLPKSKEHLPSSSEISAKSVMDTDLKRVSGNNKEQIKSASESKEGQQFSYDGREMSRAFLFEYRDTFRSSLKLREAPRLSLDSRAYTDQSGCLYAEEIQNDKQLLHANGHSHEHPKNNLQEMGDDKKRSPSVVARLMGLEVMPESKPTSQKKAELRRSASESRVSYDIRRSKYAEGNGGSQFSSSMNAKNTPDHKAVETAAISRQIFSPAKQQDNGASSLSKAKKSHQFQSHCDEDRGPETETLERMLRFPEGSIQGSLSPYLKQKAADQRPMQRYPIEAAPWRHQENWQNYQQNAFESQNFLPEHKRNSSKGSDALYSEIEKKLKERGLEENGKNLETLKQILEAMQLKSLLHSAKDRDLNQDQQSNSLQHNKLNDVDHASRMRIFNEAKLLSRQREMQRNLARPFEAPIVVMKPAKLLSNLKSTRTSEILSKNREKVGYGLSQIGYKSNGNRVCSPSNNTSLNHFGNEIAPTVRQRRQRMANEALQRESNLRRSRTSLSPQNAARTAQSSSPLSTVKSPSSSSPNKQRVTKPEIEKKARNSGSLIKERDNGRSSPGTQSPKPARQVASRKIGSDREQRSPCNKAKMKEVSAMEPDESELNPSLDNHLLDETSQRSDSNRSLISNLDLEKPSSAKNRDDDNCEAESNYIRGKDLDRCEKSLVSTEIPEQPSPVSVLDPSLYKEDCSPPPIVKRSITFTDEETRTHDDSNLGNWNRSGFLKRQCQSDEPHLVTYKMLNDSRNGILKPEIDSIKSLLELDGLHPGIDKPNPEYCYIIDILLASGLLAYTETYTVVFHSSGYPIDPQLFSVLEQTHSNLSLSKPRDGQDSRKKPNIEKMNRRLIFNTVNDILYKKLSPYLHLQPWICSANKISRRRPIGQQLLKQVWSEIQCLPSVPSEDICDTISTILEKDLAETVNSWTDHKTELAGVVLDMERMIFKDLMNETIGDLGALSSRCRQPNLLSRPRRKLHFN